MFMAKKKWELEEEEETLGEVKDSRPSYVSRNQGALDALASQVLNRKEFSYDPRTDPLYKGVVDQYVRQGRAAMEDTLGRAQAMTGGYGNSYAQTASQQAYQGYLQQLNDKIPELYQMALNKYQMEGDELYNQYALLGSQEQQDYGRYRDTVADWNTALDRAQNQYNVERDYDYGKWTDNRDFGYNQFVDDRAYNYQVQRDAELDRQWQAEFDLAVRQYEDSLAAAAAAAGGSYSSSGGGGGGGSTTTMTLTDYAANVAKQSGVEAAVAMVNSTDASQANKNAAIANAQGVAMTEYYKNRVVG